GFVTDYPLTIRHASGRTTAVLYNATIYRSEAGEVQGVFAAARDVTERNRIAAELRVASLYARNLIETSLDTLVTISPDGKITDVNEATINVTGVSRRQLVGTDFSDYFTEPDKAREGYQQVFAEGFVTDYPLTIRHASGRTIDVLYNATIYRNESGEVQGVFAAARDVTERNKMEQELARYRLRLEELVRQRTSELEKTAADLARSNKDLEQFAYVSSHDLQEPLRAVAGFMSLLKQQHNDKLDAEAHEYIGHAISGAERMQTLINDLLTYSRVGARSAPSNPVSMKEALDTAVVNLSTAVAESRAVITHDPLPTVTANLPQMIQLLQNLVGNAIKFRGPRTPEIHVFARRDDGAWLFGVRDNGIGIEAGYHDRIFLIFQRLHSRTQYPGTGIGLALCKRIVERYSGRIWFESQPGEGTTFFFTIPDKGGDE
ncbi:MAG: PAS domain S-box protein, partial [Deltaproteobacteria bacterium]|nr:PAS domain S-box protein [Deltaproteobacteria bacterium]